MNLILLQAHELTTTTTEVNDVQDVDHQADRNKNHCFALLNNNNNDARVQHILGHLGKKQGDCIQVGVIGGQQGKARIDEIIAIKKSSNTSSSSSTRAANDDNNDDDDNDNDTTTTTTSTVYNCPLAVRLVLQFNPFPLSRNQHPSANSNNNNYEPTITLILAVPFPKRLKALWSMVASMDYVTRIVLIRAALSDPDHCRSSALTMPTVYQPLIEQGLSQGKRTCHIQVDVQHVDHVVCQETLEMLGFLCTNDDDDDNNNNNNNNQSNHNDNNNNNNSHNNHDQSSCVKLFLDCGDDEIVPPSALDVVLQHFLSGRVDDDDDESDDDDKIGSDRSAERRSQQRRRRQQQQQQTPPSAVIAIGPERGWTDAEAKLFTSQAAGFQACTIGQSILRVDTAVIAGLAVVGAALNQVVVAYGTTTTTNSRYSNNVPVRPVYVPVRPV